MLSRHVKPVIPRKGHFIMDSTVEETKDRGLIMRIIYGAAETTVAKGFGGRSDYESSESRMMMVFSVGSPLRNMQICCSMKHGLMEDPLDMANGHFLRGFFRMLQG